MQNFTNREYSVIMLYLLENLGETTDIVVFLKLSFFRSDGFYRSLLVRTYNNNNIIYYDEHRTHSVDHINNIEEYDV